MLDNLLKKGYNSTMKNKILVALLLAAAATSSMAQWHRGPSYHYHYGCGGCWVGPALIGGVVGYELAQPRTVVVEQPSVVVQQPIVQAPPVGYHWQEMVDPQTGLKKVVAVPN